MFTRLLFSILSVGLLVAQEAKPIKQPPVKISLPAIHSSAANFTVDLMGTPDTRPGTWGNQGVATWKIVFNPPTGKRTRVLRASGDFVAWPPKPIAAGSSAGLLMALATTGPEGSPNASLMADNTMLYLQVATNGQVARAEYDRDVRVGGLLMPDNTLVVKVAVWLNTTGVAIHMEPTFTLIYQFE